MCFNTKPFSSCGCFSQGLCRPAATKCSRIDLRVIDGNLVAAGQQKNYSNLDTCQLKQYFFYIQIQSISCDYLNKYVIDNSIYVIKFFLGQNLLIRHPDQVINPSFVCTFVHLPFFESVLKISPSKNPADRNYS